MFLLTGEIVSNRGESRAFRSVRGAAPCIGRLRRILRAGARCFFPLDLQHQAAVRNVIADAVVDLVDAGSANPAGSVRIYDEGRIMLLSTIELGFPAFGDAAAGVAEALSMPRTDLAAANDGIAAEFEVRDRDDVLLWSGEIAQGGGDIDMAAGLEVNSSDIVRITQFSYAATP